MNYYSLDNSQSDSADERIGFGGLGSGFGFFPGAGFGRPGFGLGRPGSGFGFFPGLGFGRPGFGRPGFGIGRPFGFPFLTGLAAGALLAPRPPYFYPQYPYSQYPYYCC